MSQCPYYPPRRAGIHKDLSVVSVCIVYVGFITQRTLFHNKSILSLGNAYGIYLDIHANRCVFHTPFFGMVTQSGF